MQLSFTSFECPQPLADPGPIAEREDFCDLLAHFDQFGSRGTQSETLVHSGGCSLPIPTFVNEFWTAKQRAAHSLHEVSYRACFKPQLPRFFIERLSLTGETVYDPFMGRGTTLLEAALIGRRPLGCDINPLSRVLVTPRLDPPACSEIEGRMRAIDLSHAAPLPDELLVFYHPETLRELCALREYFRARKEEGLLDRIDQWIQMVAVNRLTGHSPGFFSVYTLPPNQAVSLQSQARINAKRGQTPPRRSVPALILRKSRSLLADGVDRLRAPRAWNEDDPILLNRQSHSTPEIASDSVRLVVTSPPFLNVVDYVTDNWLRCWFCDIELNKELMSVSASLANWEAEMRAVLQELKRVLRPDGHIAFEVGEVRRGSIKLEENVARLGCEAGLEPLCILINEQHFTKTSNCWGVQNQQFGTNTNRIVVFRK